MPGAMFVTRNGVPSKSIRKPIESKRTAALVAHVELERVRGHAVFLLQFGRQCLDPLEPPGSYQHFGALRRKRPRARRSDARACASDKDNSIV